MAPKVSLLCLLLVPLLGPAFAARPVPTAEQALKFVKDLRDTFESTRTWDKKTITSQIASLEAGQKLGEQAEALFGDDIFGPYGKCLDATLAVRAYGLSLSKAYRGVSPNRANTSALLELPHEAFRAGEMYSACVAQVQVVNTPSSKARP